MKSLVAAIAGLLFALGLGIGGMTEPQKVRGFLDIFGDWRPELLGVMAGAIGVYAFAYRHAMKQAKPVLDTHFRLPSKTRLDGRLLTGAMVFGWGWGLAGICPGPGLVSLPAGHASTWVFVTAMLAGMMLFKLVDKRIP